SCAALLMPDRIFAVLLRCLLVASIFAAEWLAAAPAAADVGPENTIVLVNRHSWASQTIANHYQQLRGVPASHIWHVDWQDDLESVDIDTFRQHLLAPVVAELEKRGIADQIHL